MKRFLSIMTLGLLLMGTAPTTSHAQLQRASAKAAVPQRTSYLVQVPFDFSLTTREEFNMCTQEQIGPQKKWFFVSSFKAVGSPNPSAEDLDSWLFLPGASFTDASKTYKLAFNMFGNMANMFSNVEVWIGTSPAKADMTTKIGSIENFINNISREDTVRQEFTFGVPTATAGTYYIGFRCCTPADVDAGWCYINHVSVSESSASASAPASVVDAKVTAAAKGGLSANVAFTMPTTDMTNAALPADKELTATLTSAVDTVTVKALPGAAMSMDVVTLQGDNTLTLQVDGDQEGTPVTYSIYTGHVLPMRVHNLTGTLSRDNLTYTLTWTAPTEGKDGGYIDTENLDYDIYLYDQQTGDYDSLTTVGHNLTYTYQLTSADQLRSVRLAVFARNVCGTSDDRINWYDEDPIYVSDMVGQPYDLPVIEEFDNQNVKYGPVRIIKDYDNYRGNWVLQDPTPIVADANQSAIVGSNPLSEDATMGRLAIAKFSTLGKSGMAFSAKVLKYVGYSSKMTFYVRDYDHDFDNLVKIGEVDCTSANETCWADYTFPIPETFMNKEWIQIVVDAQYDDVDYMYAIDRYSIASSHANDLCATGITGPAAVEVGNTGDYTAEVYNIGTQKATANGQFEVLHDGTVARTESVTPVEIASGERTTFAYHFTATADDYGKAVSIRFALNAGDEDATNDSASVAIEVRQAETPVVTTLTGEWTNDGTSLSWMQPQLNKTIAQSFESETAYDYGETLGGLTNYDGDGCNVYKFASLTIPNEQLPKAFIVVQNATFDSASEIAAHTGSKFLMATCPDDLAGQAADDWLITPEVLGGTVFSFWLDIISETYPETVKVMYSSTTADPSSFTELPAGSILKYKRGWQKQEYTLPANAKYVAIHYVSNNMFGIFVDDVRYVSANDSYTLNHYNVYRDAVKVGETVASDAAVANAYLDATVEAGTHTYHVTAVEADGTEFGKSNTVTLDTQTSGINAANAGRATVVATYATNGAQTNGLVKGVNIVRMTDGTVKKVVVK